MLPKQLEHVERADIEALVENSVHENRTIEYKSALPGGSDEERREFLADVSSFANTVGGDMLFGVPERVEDGKKTGLPDHPTGLDFNFDLETRRLNSILKDGLDPKLPTDVRFLAVAGFPAGSVLICRIRRSLALPHMVIFKNLSRFYARNGNGKVQMDIDNIRQAFAFSGSLTERVRRFREERIRLILQDEIPLPLAPGGKFVMHCLPIASAETFEHQPDVLTTFRQHTDRLNSPWRHDLSVTFVNWNFDGFLVGNLKGGEAGTQLRAYTQVFRNGTLEHADVRLAISESKMFELGWQSRILKAAASYLSVASEAGLEPPFAFGLAFLGVRGFKVFNEQRPTNHSIDRDNLILPEIWVDDFVDENSLVEALKPTFGIVYASGGWAPDSS